MTAYLRGVIMALLTGVSATVHGTLTTTTSQKIGLPLMVLMVSLVQAVVAGFSLTVIRPYGGLSVVPWMWVLAAGTLGTLGMLMVPGAVRALGATAAFTLLIASQLFIASAIDHFGFFGMPVIRMNWGRALGLGLVVGGVLLINKYRA